MKNVTLALSVLTVLTLGACTNGGDWTPMSAGRTAGEGQVEQVTHHRADDSFSSSLRK